MKKLTLAAIAIFALVLSSCEVESAGSEDLTSVDAKGKAAKKASSQIEFDLSEDCQKSEAILYAGQHIEVGKVTVTESGSNYVITYEMTNDEWCMTETHLSVVTSPEYFPITNSGNPKIGNFEYKGEHNCEKTVTYEVPIEDGPYIAAHAVVECVSNTVEMDGINLPDTAVSMCITDYGWNPENTNPDSYWDLSIENELFEGIFDGWCIEEDISQQRLCFEANLYSSYEDLSSLGFDRPENFDLINWILNQNFVGSPSGDESLYTYKDVQSAIWTLLEPEGECNLCDGNQNRVIEILDLAMENGEGFVPECGGLFGILIMPTDDNQPIIVPYPYECKETSCEETAWADGCDFPGGSWATYFMY